MTPRVLSARFSPRFLPLFYLLAAALVVTFYVGAAWLQTGTVGFPLDDAWIHQVYARNLGTRGEFAFLAGQPSAGSTSPLWGILLAVGYALRVDFRVWTFLLGILTLAGSAWAAGAMAAQLRNDWRAARWMTPLFLLGEWHMVWAAASGMEIMLFVFLSLLLVGLWWRGAPSWALGAAAGLLTLTRPEGLVLGALVGAGIILDKLLPAKGAGTQEKAVLPPKIKRAGLLSALISAFLFAGAFGLALAPYLWFNVQMSGTLLPNTFYAKAAEYAALVSNSNFFARWAMLYRQPLIGAQLLLLPGLAYGIVRLVRGGQWQLALPAAWILLLPALYAWRLPVEYQFGRYLMPIIPFVVVYGIAGAVILFEKIPWRIARRVWATATTALLVVFLALGANLYAQSVAIIQCEMVATAQWTRANLPPGALVAAHDIGAQAYWDERPLLDMAGLVSPEVIPFIRDELKLAAWMRTRGTQYAIFFPTWYPALARAGGLREVYATGCATTRAMGQENLRVYQLR